MRYAGNIASPQHINGLATAVILVAYSDHLKGIEASLLSLDAWKATEESKGPPYPHDRVQPDHLLTDANTCSTSTTFLRLGTSAEDTWLKQRVLGIFKPEFCSILHRSLRCSLRGVFNTSICVHLRLASLPLHPLHPMTISYYAVPTRIKIQHGVNGCCLLTTPPCLRHEISADGNRGFDNQDNLDLDSHQRK